MNKTLTLLFAATLLLSACGGSSQYNDKQMKKAIEDYNHAHPLCMPVIPAIDSGVANVLGSDTVRFLKTDTNGKRVNSNAVKQMTALTKAGLYKKQKDEKDEKMGKKAWVAVYQLTKKGEQFIDNTMGNRALCIGTLRVQDIQWFSEPTADRGLTVTRVAYHGKYQLHKWAEKALAFGQNNVYQNLSQPIQSQAMLVKTNKGWVDIRETQTQ
ncbi:MAG: hypothetical protein IJ187_04945 [Neisseriaceae bacterium]|nr:hypothetical protein [Neisseriaceae bacterium]